ncbi:MAG TPA: hypothetical protein VMU33_08225 [Burkholderiaceae bacterium]|nr:hypothetical protein [Burkholderiaceae bacterium]
MTSILLGWTALLSGYPLPAKVPTVVSAPHAVVVEHAGGSRDCKVWDWNAGGNLLSIDARLDPLDDLLAASVIMHEMTNVLQATRGKLDHRTNAAADGSTTAVVVDCDRTRELERVAHPVQQVHLVRYGVYRPIGLSMHPVGRAEESARQRVERTRGNRENLLIGAR